MPWDMAAGSLLITEAGGTITDIFGGAFHLEAAHILATNGKIHHDMIRILERIDAVSHHPPS
jgi:myo-inositol-1(or 4)-monophosphatase